LKDKLLRGINRGLVKYFGRAFLDNRFFRFAFFIDTEKILNLSFLNKTLRQRQVVLL